MNKDKEQEYNDYLNYKPKSEEDAQQRPNWQERETLPTRAAYHQSKTNIAEVNDIYQELDSQMSYDLEEKGLEQRTKYHAKMNGFLNNGIIIVGVLLILVLVVAFLL